MRTSLEANDFRGTINRALRGVATATTLRSPSKGALFASAFLVSVSLAAPDANRITGTIRNGTTGQLAQGDDVLLLRLDDSNGITEQARAVTDAQGAFALDLQRIDSSCLIRVVHQHVNYEQPCAPNQPVFAQVFDSAAHVNGITGSIEILRVGTNGALLHVSDMYEVKNESNPPMTQAGERSFEVYLPAKAKLDSVLAAAPGKTGVIISASPVGDVLGHYRVGFPLKPGASKFAFNYDLPYHGEAAFKTRIAYPLQQFAVMFPPTMKFSSNFSAFKALATGASNYEVQAAIQLQPGLGPSFEISGAGAFPPLREQPNAQGTPRSLPSRDLSPPGQFAVSLAPAHGGNGPRVNGDPRFVEAPPQSALVLRVLAAALLACCGVVIARGRRQTRVEGNRKHLTPN